VVPERVTKTSAGSIFFWGADQLLSFRPRMELRAPAYEGKPRDVWRLAKGSYARFAAIAGDICSSTRKELRHENPPVVTS